MALSTALLLSFWSPVSAQDASPPPAGASSGAPGATTAPKASSPSANAPSGPTQGKILYTVPEDGLGAVDVPASSRLVRDLVDKHRDEDVIICLAGCRSSVDRVVYAQPSDIIPGQPAAISDSTPSAPVKPQIKNAVQEKPAAETATSQAKPSEAKASEVKAPEVKPEMKSAAQPAAQPATDSAEKPLPQLVPTMALPKDGEPAAKLETAPPAAADTKPSAAADGVKPDDAAPESKAQ